MARAPDDAKTWGSVSKGLQLQLFDRAALLVRNRRWRLARRARDRAHGRLVLAGGLIYNDRGEVLLIRRSTPQLTQWETPGGKLDRGESPQQTAVRELNEELGIRVELVADMGAHDFVSGETRMRYALFSMRIADGVPKLIEPMFDDWRFFTWLELATMRDQLSPNARNIVNLHLRGRLPAKPIEQAPHAQPVGMHPSAGAHRA